MKLVVLLTVALVALGCATSDRAVLVKVTPGYEPDCHRGPLECRQRVMAGGVGVSPQAGYLGAR